MTWGGHLLVMVFGMVLLGVRSQNQNDVKETESSVYEADLYIFENKNGQGPTYRFEDFFWTGSGDDTTENNFDPWIIETPPTIYTTKTVTTTVYSSGVSTIFNGSDIEITTKCLFNCEGSNITNEVIAPTPTYVEETTIDNENAVDADRQFWIVTVLKSHGKDPVIIDLTNSLSKLYNTAFQRQQERHLGINNKRRKRAIPDKPVNVYIHNIDKEKTNGDENIKVLYHVSVSGKPVSATTAVADMKLISDEEVQKELGFPFVVKAEPYLKAAALQGLTKAKHTWIFIGVSIMILIVLLLLVAFITVGCKKRKRTPSGIDNRKQIFERGAVDDHDGLKKRLEFQRKEVVDDSPTYINFRRNTNKTFKSDVTRMKLKDSYSPTSSSSTSIDISPLMTVRKQRTPPKKPPRPRAALNKTVPVNIMKIAPELYDSDINCRQGSIDTIYDGNDDPGVISPKSYLSMPSVRSFPRINNPEPLNKVLEPVSVQHLDMPDDHDLNDANIYNKNRMHFVRHGSVNNAEDPGVIGPVVWDMHQQRLQHGVSVDEGMDEMKLVHNVSRMRKRFNELLDDTFSLFGSRRASPIEDAKLSVPEIKSRSAINCRPEDNFHPTLQVRPKTACTAKLETATSKPKGAWHSKAPSPLVRPVSAGPVAPRVNVDLVLAEGTFRANDPAIPLIEAIKSEIERCSLPGSTTDLTRH